jgi:hypothetical protein
MPGRAEDKKAIQSFGNNLASGNCTVVDGRVLDLVSGGALSACKVSGSLILLMCDALFCIGIADVICG